MLEMKKKERLAVKINQFDGDAVTFDQVKAFLDTNKDSAEVKAYYKSNVLTADNVKTFLETSEAKKVLQPKLDAHFTKSLETWKANNLESLVEEEVNKRNPEKSPAEKEVEKLRAEIEKERKSRERADLSSKALKVAQEKKLPTEIIDYLIGENEEVTLANLSKFEEAHTKAVQAAVDSKFKESGRHIEQGGGNSDLGSIDINSLAAEASIRK